jgi:uncharacterized phage protein gp47/JayE
MALFQPRIFPEIVGEMINRLISITPLTDVNFGSVFTVMLEAAAQEDDEQYFQMLELIRAYSLDTTSGTDLDDRAFEYGLERLAAQTATTSVIIGDSAIIKIFTPIYSGLPGASAGTLSVNGDSATGFPTTGSIIVGRGTPNVETVSYTSITVFPNYVRFNLSAALAYDHGTDETIVLSQGGNRLIPAGAVVKVPASDLSPEVTFSLNSSATILDGEREVQDVEVTALEAGSNANVPIGTIIQFDSLPFSTAYVFNPSRITNGRDIESDQELRDRIKNTIQSLSRGTVKSIITGILDLVSSDDNKRVVSAAAIEPTIPADVVKLFIDDGTGFVPSFRSVGFEEVVPVATGGEKFVEVINFPIVKAFVETQNEEPYNMTGTTNLFVEVGGQVETITFVSTDFVVPAAASAQEILQAINRNSSLFEARVSSGGSKIRIFSRQNFDEEIRVTGGSANVALNFPPDKKFTTKLYLRRNNTVRLLQKDGSTAVIESGNSAAYNMSDYRFLTLIVDSKRNNLLHIDFEPSEFLNASSVTAKEVAEIINEQLPGAEAFASSNDTRISITSNIKKDESSKVRIVENFTKILSYNSTLLTFGDITTQSRTSAVNVMIFSNDQDMVYVGHVDIKFKTISVFLSTPASEPMNYILEFFNGSTFEALGHFDGTASFTQNGVIRFHSPEYWQKTTINGQGPYYWVRIKRDQTSLAQPPVESRIRICSANEIFGFSEGERSGSNSDYTLNRFIGQIELKSPLLAGDELTLGSKLTRASMISNNQPFGLVGGEVLNIEIDGQVQTITFQSSDFFTPGAALAAEVITRLNKSIRGAEAELFGVGRVRIRTNTWGDSGSIRSTGGSANTFLQFTQTVVSNLTPHVASVESGTQGPWTFPASQFVVVIMDGNSGNNLTVPLFRQGQVQSATTTTIVETNLNITFPLAEDLTVDSGYDVLITSGAQSGQRRTITNYVPATGTITLSSALPSAPLLDDQYQIIPRTAYQVEKLWRNRLITLITTQADIRASSSGTRIQIASLVSGELGSVQVTGGSGNAILQFNTLTIIGIDGYRHFTGLAQKVQWTIDGRQDDQDNYPGIRAGGVQVEVLEPVRRPIRVEVAVVPREGITLSSLANDVKSAISAYINALPVGGDVIVSDIIYSVKDVSGVFDVTMRTPMENIAIADNELARIDEKDIIVG